MDIFALGILFHQYFTGELPGFDREVNSYPGEAVANGATLQVSSMLPSDLQALFSRMLDPDPDRRPSAEEVFYALCGIREVSKTEPAAPRPGGSPFYRPGKLKRPDKKEVHHGE